jgi:hypothetical protein
MKKRMLTIGLAGLVLCGSLSLQGCYGSFALTKKVYNWNGTLGNKWVKSIVFFVFGFVLPVYGLSAFIDAIALNLVEFWTGSNPLAAAQTHMDKSYADGTRVQADRLPDGRLSVHMVLPSGEERSWVMTHEVDGISVADVKGNWMGKVAQTAQGTVMIHPQVALAP